MNVFEFQAGRIETTAELLAHALVTTPPKKQDWRPTLPGAAPTRSALEQVGECVVVNHYFAALLRGESPQGNPLAPGAPVFASATEGAANLLDSARELAEAVRALPDDALQNTVAHWRGPLPVARALDVPNRNMAYHAGQINFIQLLAGDSEYHLPPAQQQQTQPPFPQAATNP